ncbi:MAG: FAD-binding oxidoreductase [Candidatus Berkiella sp.]
MKKDAANKLITLLRSQFDDASFYTEPSDCWAYGYDNSRRHALPDAVVFASCHEDVVRLVKLCAQHNIPLIARGRGTNTTGAAVPIKGGIVLSLERMQKIIEIDPQNRFMVVEPGVLNQSAQEAAQKMGLFWAPDPTSAPYSSIGGNIACGAAGPRSVKYGTTKDNVLGLTAVTGTGHTIHTGVYTTKGSVGYDLTRLMIGSEGTLGIVTSAILKLLPLPETKRTLRAFFSSMPSALSAVIKVMQQPIIPCGVEFMDGNAVRMVRNFSHPELPENAQSMLIIEVDGSHSIIDHDLQAIVAAIQHPDLLEVNIARSEKEAAELWKIRKSLSASLRSLSPHKINEDIIVPVSKVSEILEFTEMLSKQYEIQVVNFGHAGNGNIHVNFLVDPFDPIKGPQAKACLLQLFDKVLSLKGSLSGEHGVGIEKRDYIDKEIDNDTLCLMKNIKAQFDPQNILNPGKIFPE